MAAEMKAIFAPLPRPRLETSGMAEAESRAPASRRGYLWLWTLLLILAATIIAAASILFLARTSRAPLPQLPHQAAPARDTPTPLPAILPEHPSTSAAATAAPPPDQVDSAPSAPKARAAHPSQAKRVRRRENVARRHGGCRAGATDAWCLHGDITAADSRLRDAYAAAIRSGVDRRTLGDVRDDWSRLRRRANKDPEALIRGYGILTQELRAEARRARRR